jgi:uncharacterized protein (DUF488 family)
MPTIYTVGHSTRRLDELIALLRAAGVSAVADVRRWPVSSRHPHFSAPGFGDSLAAAGIGYHHLGGPLGGYREGGYSAYTETVEFGQGLETLERLAAAAPLAVL